MLAYFFLNRLRWYLLSVKKMKAMETADIICWTKRTASETTLSLWNWRRRLNVYDALERSIIECGTDFWFTSYSGLCCVLCAQTQNITPSILCDRLRRRSNPLHFAFTAITSKQFHVQSAMVQQCYIQCRVHSLQTATRMIYISW